MEKLFTLHTFWLYLTQCQDQHISSNNQPHANLLGKPQRQQYVKLLIALVEVWYDEDCFFFCFPQPSLSYGSNAGCSYNSATLQPVHIQNISGSMQAVVQGQLAEGFHWETQVAEMSSYNL